MTSPRGHASLSSRRRTGTGAAGPAWGLIRSGTIARTRLWITRRALPGSDVASRWMIVWLFVTALWHIGCMRSQVITIMAPEDEAAFLRFVFERPTVYLIPE